MRFGIVDQRWPRGELRRVAGGDNAVLRVAAQIPARKEMACIGALGVAGRLEQHQARDLAALDRLQLLVDEFMVAGRNEPEHAGGESPQGAPGPLLPDFIERR